VRRPAPAQSLYRTSVLAAMSGVDSAVAAARAVEAGHDVVGVHLALARAGGTLRTGSRGCCTIEDAMDARRAADLLGIPFYVWDFSERFREDVIDDFVAEYRAGRTRIRACAATRRSSSPPSWSVRWSSASTPCAPDTTRRSSTAPTASNCTAPPMRPRTSPTCWAC
jgi:hypothetical protein